MNTVKINMRDFVDFCALLSADRDLYLPLNVNGDVVFDKWISPEESSINFGAVNTVKSPKDLFFPHSENIAGFKMQGKNISVIVTKKEMKPFVLFGVRQCDVKSFEVLDRVFLADPVDEYYAQRRENATVISLACARPDTSCFCKVFDIDASEPALGGTDAAAWIEGENMYLKPLTEKGEYVVSLAGSLASALTADDENELDGHKKKIKSITLRLPYSNLSLDKFGGDALNAIFDSPKWASLSETCLSCGTCTFICPTCQCYDIRDYDTGHGISRYRCWDSCMCSDFTRMAHGNPRTSTLERFRQRYMHKLVYFPANNGGEFSCVGCGRCITKCPISMNIVKVIKEFSKPSENEEAKNG